MSLYVGDSRSLCGHIGDLHSETTNQKSTLFSGYLYEAVDTLETSVLLPETEDSSSTELPIPTVLSMQLRNWNETKSIHLFTTQHTSGYRLVESRSKKEKWTR